jgi:DNA primase
LYKAGLSNDDIEALGFYYCERLQRVVMPVYHEGTLLYWQARGFNTARAKYINPIVPKDTLVARFGKGDTLVLTEDILSAHKVGKVTEAWALMGTALADGVANLIAAKGKPVLIMLDPDKAGVKARGKIYKQLGALGVDVRIARLARDPKLLTKEELSACVNLK